MSSTGLDPLSVSLAAAAHPVRRGLLALVQGEPARVTDLAARFDISLPAISRHLKVLEAARMVERRVDGRDHFIAARADGLEPMADWVARQSAHWQARLDSLKSLMETRDG